MAQQLIANLEGGGPVRAAINGNFTELYGALTFPYKLLDIDSNAQQQIPAGSFVTWILIIPIAGAPVIRIGRTGGGDQILEEQSVTDFTPVAAQQWFAAADNIYITLSGGAVSVCIITIPNAFQ